MTVTAQTDTPTVHIDGTTVGIQHPGERIHWYCRDDLATAILLRLYADPALSPGEQTAQVFARLMGEGFDNREALRLAKAASTCLTYDIDLYPKESEHG